MKVFLQVLLILGCMVNFTAVADDSAAQFDSEPYSIEQAAIRGQQRALFKKAEYAAKRGRMLEYQRLLQQLDDYPLTPYLELIRLQKVGYLANEDRVVEFLERYQGSPLDWQLRGRWLDYLAKKDEGERFLRDFRQPGSTEHQCLYLTYQHQQGMDAATFNEAAKNLWLHGESLPSECDRVFAIWRQQKQLTPALVWQRIQLAAEGGSHSLIPYLQGLLPEPQRYLADRYYEVRRDPSQVSKLQRYPGTFPEQEAQIITYALRRLIWRDPDLALDTFKLAARKVAFSYEQRQRIYDAFAVALSVEEHPQALVWQQRIPPENLSDRVLQWRLAELLRQQDFAGLLQLIERLPSNVQQGNIWRYWRARALEHEGDPLAAQGLFMDLADERHYYGFLAAAWLKQPVSLAQDPIDVAPAVLRKIVKMPAAQRAYEFLQLQRPVDARREWQYLLSQLSVSEQQAAAIVANQWGWHDQAIFGLAQAGYYDAVKIRFPLAYYDDLRRGAERANIDVNWALAITRRESAFRNDAYSSAGARGLMQILPSTAKYLHKKTVSRLELHNPSLNTRLGTAYLGDLKSRMHDNWVLATASYNAGYYRVRDWLPEQPMPLDIWIELVPYHETRDYLKAVLAYQQIYQLINGGSENIFDGLVDMTISKQD